MGAVVAGVDDDDFGAVHVPDIDALAVGADRHARQGSPAEGDRRLHSQGGGVQRDDLGWLGLGDVEGAVERIQGDEFHGARCCQGNRLGGVIVGVHDDDVVLREVTDEDPLSIGAQRRTEHLHR